MSDVLCIHFFWRIRAVRTQPSDSSSYISSKKTMQHLKSRNVTEKSKAASQWQNCIKSKVSRCLHLSDLPGQPGSHTAFTDRWKGVGEAALQATCPAPGLVLTLSPLGNGNLPAISFQGTVFRLPNRTNVHKDNSNLESKTLMSTYRENIYNFLQNLTKKIIPFTIKASFSPLNNPYWGLRGKHPA